MPELPEVETVVRGLEPVALGQTIQKVQQRRPNLRFPFPKRFVHKLEGSRIRSIKRRAKYILVFLQSEDVLVIHLGMSGRFLIEDNQKKDCQTNTENSDKSSFEPASAHDHVVMELSNGIVLKYNDARRFGFMTIVPKEELLTHDLFKHLGAEPLGNEFNEHYLAEKAIAKKQSIKSFLMDQKNIAGLGNIYVCEALHRAKISPQRAATCLLRGNQKPSLRAQRLAPAIKTVLTDAIESGGSTLRDHRQADGSLGYFQHSFTVYGREGQACKQRGCEGQIKRTVQAGRSTFYCTVCQR